MLSGGFKLLKKRGHGFDLLIQKGKPLDSPQRQPFIYFFFFTPFACSITMRFCFLLVAAAAAAAPSAKVTATSHNNGATCFSFIAQKKTCLTRKPSAHPLERTFGTTRIRGQMDMKVSKGKSKHRKDSTVAILNNDRKRNAGRRGTKRFVDPNKLFIGNLPYTACEETITEWLGVQLGSTHNIHSVKIIRDWKTGQSKGYGFVMFSDPIYATHAIEHCRGKKLDGRVVALNQGQKKVDPNTLYVQKRKRDASEDEEDQTIDNALDEAEGRLEDDASLDSLQAFDSAADGDLFEEEDDEDVDLENFVYDGVFEEEYKEELYGKDEDDDDKQMNREQRREAAKRKPRRKLPHKGFGPQVETQLK